MSLDTVPKEARHLRACKLCSLVKTHDQFLAAGCDNCERWLELKGNREAISECTSHNFDGLISLMSPVDSWVARWQRIERCVQGCYAVSVSGDLPYEITEMLKERGVAYRSRDRRIQH
ncbi:transcription elongation factor SPT4-A-like [Dysidea avara]|uniref:transcription elongation factor SPT4-A-like n=1 Tax=Dysidea avara TaxID=196820 RepID=UPI00332F9196